MNILLTSVGRRTYLIDYFKECIKDNGEVHASNSIFTYSMTHADKWTITPNIYENQYVDFLLNYCQKNHIEAIISLFDIDLPILAKNKILFENAGVKIIVSDIDKIRTCNDKWETFIFLKKNNILTPETFLTIKDVKTALNNGTISFPIIMKPRWGMGSIGIYVVDNMEELEILYKKLKREIFKTYLKFESEEDKNNCIIFQRKIDGQEYGLEVFNNLQGEYITTIAKKKIAMRAGETDVAEIVNPSPFLEIAKKISESMKHIANLDIDCFIDKNNAIYVLEMNCRFGGQYPFSHIAGVNFPKQIIMWLQGLETSAENITPRIGAKGCKDLNPVLLN